jgi:LPXTG-site transpeptidase (sortase) family protein
VFKVQKSHVFRFALPLVVVGLIGYSCVSFALIYIPVFVNEVRYHYYKTLQDVFHVRSLRGLVLPHLELDPSNHSSHEVFGIAIPSLFLDEPVIANIDPNDAATYKAALTRGIAHAVGTALPGDGVGVGYYFAHSSLPDLRQQYNAVFYSLGKLQTGDTVYVWHDGEKHTYHVTEKRVIAPSDLAFLENPSGVEAVVLQTCWPPGTTAQRLIVRAEK